MPNAPQENNFFASKYRIWLFSTLIFLSFTYGCQQKENARAEEGQYKFSDNPETSNDESNDQPVGYYGDKTMQVRTPHNGENYTLDVEFDGENPTSVYFPKGGNVDFSDCSGGDGSWECIDEDGKEWTIEE